MPFIDSPQDQSVGMWDAGAGDYSPEPSGGMGLHVGAAALIFLAIAYKAITDSNLVNTDYHQFRMTWLAIFGVVLAYAAGKIAFLTLTGFMASRGILLPGQGEIAQLL
jgi:hypothetical protein